MSFHHWSKEDHGFRFWWHAGNRSVFCVEMAFLRSHCHASIETGDSWKISAAIPGIALWLTFEGFGLWHPQRKCIATWDGNREFWLNDQRECRIDCHDWTIHVVPWGKSMEWCKADPWWVRGLSFDVKRFVLGRTHHSTITLKDKIPLAIPMPEGTYPATAKIVQATWRRSRWLPSTRTYVQVDVPKGIPFAGKGENSWDCGDDGLFGYSVEGTSLEHAIAHGVESVLKSRRRYGKPSNQAIKDALSASA